MAMPRALRVAVAVAGISSAALALGFVLEWDRVTDLWPWPDGRYSYLFVGSILAAVAGAAVLVWRENDLGVLPPGALNLTVTLGGQSAFLLTQGYPAEGLVLGAGAVANAGVWWWTRRLEPRDRTPLPRPARMAFVVFVVALVAAGGALLLGAEHVFPWPLDEDSAVMFGWIFLGDACFFAYGAARPFRAYARPQLLAFLAYDLVLIGPFLALADDVQSGHGASLVVYTAVLIASAAVAVWYLAVDPTTRLRSAT